MDETPTYIDMVTNRTIDIRGAKSIEINHTGQIKSRFTVVLIIAANEFRLPTYVILRKRFNFKFKCRYCCVRFRLHVNRINA